MDTNAFTLSSGRVISVTEFGDRAAKDIVVLAHAAPGSSRFDPDPSATDAAPVRVIAVDRPGYGGSQLVPFETVAVHRSAADIAEYLAAESITSDRLALGELRSVGAAGWSAGGRIALALAAANPELVSRVAVIATPAPDDAVPWVGDDNRALLENFRGMPPSEATVMLAAMLDEFNGAEPSPEQMLRDVMASQADDALRESAGDRLLGMMAGAGEQGNLGTAADVLSYTLVPWGFDLADVRAEVLLVYGELDEIVGPDHARWFERQLPTARDELVPDVGHLVVIPAWKRVLEFLRNEPNHGGS